MKPPRYTRRFSSLLLVGSVAAYWGISGDSNLVPEPERASTDHVDSYLIGARIAQYDDSGRLVRVLAAEQVEHRTGSDSNHLQAPDLTLYPDGTAAVEIRARQAITTDHNNLIELRQQVRLEQHNERPSQLHTEQLFLRPDADFAWTAEPVAYYQGSSITEAVGMNAYFDQRKVELLSEVQGRYETR